MKEIIPENNTLIFECPHCAEPVIVYLPELNCRIFRHGTFKHNLKQIDPHLPKHNCDHLFNLGLIFGCGKPFEIIIENNKYFVTICEYK